MREKVPEYIPKMDDFINPTLKALRNLGGSGKNEDICEEVIKIMDLSEEAICYPHLGSERQTEVQYRLAWARTYLKVYGALENSDRSAWSLNSDYMAPIVVDPKYVRKIYRLKEGKKDSENVLVIKDLPNKAGSWRIKLYEILMQMDPHAFEVLIQRVLGECGLTQIEVTKKTGDGGINGYGLLELNGIFSFNIAFQCKRHKGDIDASDIRDFRGSLTTNIEKGLFMTTGSFTKAARAEATSQGKQQIDLMDGEKFINKLLEYRIGIKEVKTYEINDEYFKMI